MKADFIYKVKNRQWRRLRAAGNWPELVFPGHSVPWVTRGGGRDPVAPGNDQSSLRAVLKSKAIPPSHLGKCRHLSREASLPPAPAFGAGRGDKECTEQGRRQPRSPQDVMLNSPLPGHLRGGTSTPQSPFPMQYPPYKPSLKPASSFCSHLPADGRINAVQHRVCQRRAHTCLQRAPCAHAALSTRIFFSPFAWGSR